MHVAGSLVTLAGIATLGALSFGGLAILVASRARNVETMSGLMNAVMLPMFVLSGVFFSTAHFPARLHGARLGLAEVGRDQDLFLEVVVQRRLRTCRRK